MQPPVPDWQKNRLCVVEPSIWSRYRRGRSDLRPVHETLVEALCSIGTEPHVLTGTDYPIDIWIRDWGFVEGAYFKFAPTYAKHLYSPSAISAARASLDRHAETRRRFVPLTLDGGNLVHDGITAILTEKVIVDNPQLSRLEIERAILSLGFHRVVFIPVEPDDVIGHADGIVRFLSSEVLLVNDYTGTHFNSYRRRLWATLKKANLSAALLPFPWCTTEEINDGVWSAVGCYINFIQTNRGIVLPTFENRLDERAAQVAANLTDLPLRQVYSTRLARLGGVLNCISLGWSATKPSD